MPQLDLEQFDGYTSQQWEREGLRITVAGRGVIAHVPTPNVDGVFECRKNARLIAAAPQLLSELREARAKLAEREWQDIETAPKDGSFVFLWIPDTNRLLWCAWRKPERANWGDRFGDDHNLPPQWTTFDGFALDRRNGPPMLWYPITAPDNYVGPYTLASAESKADR